MRNIQSLVLMLALSVVFVSSVLPSVAQPAVSTPKHPILGRMFIWLIRSNYKPKEVTPQQADAQARLTANDDYKFALDRAKQLGYEPIPGEIKEVRVPDWHKSKFLFYFIPISLVYFPTAFLLQPVATNADNQHGVIIGVEQNTKVSSAVYLDANRFGDAGKINEDAPKQKFTHYVRKDVIDRCGVPCLNKMMGCSFCLTAAPLSIHAAVGAYLTCVLANKECGGCLLDELAQAVLDYAVEGRTEPLDAKPAE
jgi:hypothetical protein